MPALWLQRQDIIQEIETLMLDEWKSCRTKAEREALFSKLVRGLARQYTLPKLREWKNKLVEHREKQGIKHE